MNLKKYFAGSVKKREVSDNSANGDDLKKQRESGLNDSQNVEDIFAERLFSPSCVAITILVNCVNNVETQIAEIFSTKQG